MEKPIKLLPSIMPNFIPYQIGDKREHISIVNLSEKEAIEYGELMKQAFIKHWRLKTK